MNHARAAVKDKRQPICAAVHTVPQLCTVIGISQLAENSQCASSEVSTPVILLRKLNCTKLCNGTRPIVTGGFRGEQGGHALLPSKMPRPLVAVRISQKPHVQFPPSFGHCYFWPLLGPPLTALQYVLYFRFCDHVFA